MFSLKEFIKKGLIGAIGKMAEGWLEKGVLTETDLAEIQTVIEAQYPIETLAEIEETEGGE